MFTARSFLFSSGFCLMSSVAAADEKSTPASILYDSSGDFAGNYLCLGSASGGVRFDSRSNSWEGATFKTDEDRYIFTVEALGSVTRPAFFTGAEESVMQYHVTASNFDQTSPGSCSWNGEQLEKISRQGDFRCNSALVEYSVNISTMRFMATYRQGYIDGQDNNFNTPSVTIGQCSKF
ncbi:hypothetical protein [Paracoccus nototheniae]|uniref:Uncharacterized protein n=1 Tax=Paracoccus nototheniae TaxID=2489002 RepID=A0ABW4DW88_9RHOB|nr:hypothetical protein [Paracoccus nototheniae]